MLTINPEQSRRIDFLDVFSGEKVNNKFQEVNVDMLTTVIFLVKQKSV